MKIAIVNSSYLRSHIWSPKVILDPTATVEAELAKAEMYNQRAASCITKAIDALRKSKEKEGFSFDGGQIVRRIQ
jgi:hypothetical protein